MSEIGEQTLDAVANAVNDTFGDPIMDLPDAPAAPAWRRLVLPVGLALLLAVIALLWWRRRRAARKDADKTA